MADTNVFVSLVIHFVFPLCFLLTSTRVATLHSLARSLSLSRSYIKEHTHTHINVVASSWFAKNVTEFPSVLNFCLFSGQSLGNEPLCGFTSTLSISAYWRIGFFPLFSPFCFILSLFPPFSFLRFSLYHRITVFEITGKNFRDAQLSGTSTKLSWWTPAQT